MPINDNGTSHIKIAVGTDAQRPAVPSFGMMRGSITSGNLEWYDPSMSSWKYLSQPSGYLVNFLIVAGGGSGATVGNGGSGIFIISYQIS